MKRGIKALLLIFVTLFSCFSSMPIPSSAINIGDTLIFEITDTELFIDMDSNNYQRVGFLFSHDYYPTHTKVNTTVNSISGFNSGITYLFTVQNKTSYAHRYTNWLSPSGLEFSYYTLYYTYLMVEDWENRYWFDITLYKIQPHVSSGYPNYLDNLDTLGSDICELFEDFAWLYPDIECEYRFTENDGIYYFESWVGGKIDGYFGELITGTTNLETDIKFGNGFHFAFNKKSGVVLGFGRRGWVEGKINNIDIKNSISCEYKLEGYDFPEYEFGNMKYFGNNNLFLLVLLAPLTTLLIIAPIIIYFIRTRKLKKLIKAQEEKQNDNKTNL
ncbi:MAG: choice-of-anchor S family protein [Candidatus Heimdallarchaeota archaeon]